MLDPAALIEFLTPRMAAFMVPRYIRIVTDLPKTPTQKVQKHLLRAEGITARHLGSREGRHPRQARASVSLTIALLPGKAGEVPRRGGGVMSNATLAPMTPPLRVTAPPPRAWRREEQVSHGAVLACTGGDG